MIGNEGNFSVSRALDDKVVIRLAILTPRIASPADVTLMAALPMTI
jgi:hypothetical protein